MINVYEILRTQKTTDNPELTKLVFIHAITTYLLSKNETNFKALLLPFGSLINTYNIQVSVNDIKRLKRKYSGKDVLIQLAEIILNNSGYENNLLTFLKTLVTYHGNN